jgi:hypothetical protein
VSWAAEVLARREVWGRAPSAHNTQPWLVTEQVSGADTWLAVGWDESRHLAQGDPTRRDLLLGLGALVQSLVIVGAEQGHGLRPQWQVDVAGRRAAVLRRVGPAVTAAAGPWGSVQLLARRTARSAYREPWVTASQVVEVAAAADLPDGAGLTVVDPAWVERWLPVADRWSLEGPAAAELPEWLRLSPRHPRYDQDGLSDQALGLGRVEAAVLRLATTAPVRRLLSGTGAVRLLARAATARPLGTVVALTAPAGLPPAGVGELGSGLLRVWLAAADRGWSAHPLSALLDCPDSRAAWTSGRTGEEEAPYAVFRLGVATRPAPASARL